MEKTAVNPYIGKKLSDKLEGLWRYRSGKYRVIYMIDERESERIDDDNSHVKKLSRMRKAKV